MTKHYLGDGLYVSADNTGMFKLRAPREDGDHWVGLEPEVLLEFLRYVRDTEPTLLTEIMRRLRFYQTSDRAGTGTRT